MKVIIVLLLSGCAVSAGSKAVDDVVERCGKGGQVSIEMKENRFGKAVRASCEWVKDGL